MSKKQRWARIGMHLLTLFYGTACLWLFYQQSVADLSVSGDIPFQSDLPLHISMVVEDGWKYSFTAYVYELLYRLFHGTFGIALFLALVALLTVYMTEALVCFLGRYPGKNWYTLLLSLSINFLMPIFIPQVGEFRYVSYQVANIWHNSTYLCMRLAALAVLLMYFKLEQKYREGISVREWAVFALLNIICTGIKPSFLVAFAPVMGIFLLVDLFRRVSLRRILVFGSSLLPSGLVILWQNSVLFGEDTGNGIGFKPWYSFSLHTNIPKLAVVCSALFCGMVLLATCRQLLVDKRYLFITVMTALGFLEALCLVESGGRAVDGNFMWGYSFCLFVMFAVCAVKWLEFRKRGGQRVARTFLGLIYGWHLYCGLYFFINLVLGVGFWMR